MSDERTWEAWEGKHQPYEFEYHKNTGVAWCSDERQFRDWWIDIFDFAEFEGRAIENALDIGCGPRPPLSLIAQREHITVIEPLADKYKTITPPEWWDGITAYAQPAEEFIQDLRGHFDTILCWNCLDHTIGWKQILENIYHYASDDALIAIATDFHPPGIGHPGFERDDFIQELHKHFTIMGFHHLSAEGQKYKDRDAAWVLEKKL